MKHDELTGIQFFKGDNTVEQQAMVADITPKKTDTSVEFTGVAALALA
jgi:hypothetical protein